MKPLFYLLLVPLSFSWIPADNTQTGFTLHYGTGAGTYEESLPVGNVTKYQRDFDFNGASKICFVVTAENKFGASGPSNEVCLSTPKKPVVFSIK